MQAFFNKKNYLGLAVAIGIMIVGFYLLGLKPATNKWAMNVAPFLLTFAFLVVVPWSLWKGWDKEERKNP